MLFVAVVHVTLESQPTLGPDWIVVALVDSVCPPAQHENVVDVAVISQPVPEPVASPMSSPCVVVGVWFAPLRVADQLTAGGVDTNASDPAESVAVAEVAPAEDAISAAVNAIAPVAPIKAAPNSSVFSRAAR